MKKLLAAALTLAIASSGLTAFAAGESSGSGTNSPAAGAEGGKVPTLAFPTAGGGGMYTKGARGALYNGDDIEIYHVTKLSDSGEGSFRDAVSKGNRIVVFDVSGMIDLNSQLTIGHDNITILGQTAPGDGICFRSNNIKVGASNVILRYLRFRVGSKMADGNDTRAQDGLEVTDDCQNVIIDHCSISWGTDENLSAYAVKDVTVQNCIIAEALNQSVHDKGEHSYGGIWGGVNVSFHHNIIATHKSRNPKIGTSETVSMTSGYTDEETVVDMWNNVIYNWGDKAGYGAENGANVNIVNNYYKPGPATPDGKRARIFELSPGNKYQTKWSGSIYASGNYVDDNGADAELVNAENWQVEKGTGVYLDAGGINTYSMLDSLPEKSYLYNREIQTAQEAYEDVIANAGARLPKLDLVDSRIIENVVNGTAPETGSNGSAYLLDDPVDGIPEGQEDLYDDRGYPLWVSESRVADYDADGDGIADEWEDKMGLDKTNPHDSLNIGPDGYTWLEIFGESLISDNTIDETVKISSENTGEGNVTLSVNAADAVKAEFYSGDKLIAESDEMLMQGIENGDTVIAAGYNDGVLAEVKAAVYGDGFETPSVSGDEKRVFIWDSLSGMKPVDGVLLGYSADAVLDPGMNVISAKLYSLDGTSKITPVSIAAVKQETHEDETVSGNFDVVGTLEDIPNLVSGAYTGIYVDNFAIAVGYDDNFNKVVRYGKIDENVPSDKDDRGYKYIKISVRGGHADLYAAATLAQWDKLSDNGYDYKGTNPKAGTYVIPPQSGAYEAVVPWRVITEQTTPSITINNIEDNSRIGYDENINVTVSAGEGSTVSEISVMFNNDIIKTVSGLSIDENGQTIDIPISFESASEGTLKVMCFDENLCSDDASVKVYVSDDLTPWQIADIGAEQTDVKTYVSVTNDYTYKINSPEGNIGATSDKCGYVYQKFTGDNRIYYRSRMQGAKQFGIMLRKSLDAESEMYFFGGEIDGGKLVYKLKKRAADGTVTDEYTLDSQQANLYFVAEKAGDKLNIYQTENGATIYTTKTLLTSLDVSSFGDEYYMGFAASGGGSNSPDAGWIGIDNSSDNSYVWNFDYGLDWCWQIQEANVLSPEWTDETIGGNSTGKMVIMPDDSYSGERYIFHEYIMDDEYVPEMSADVMLTGDEPALNVYLQTGEADTAYKITFDSDKKIKDANGSEIGEWDSTGFYNIKMAVGIDAELIENTCELTITAPDGNIITEACAIPADDNFRQQNNIEKKTPVTKAVYFEPVYGASGAYYIDNVSVTSVESDIVIERSERFLNFEDQTANITDEYTTADGFTVLSGMAVSSSSKTISDERFTKRIQMDKGNTSPNAISFDVSGPAEIKIYAAQGGTSGIRNAVLDNGTEQITTVIGEVNVFTADYEGDAATLTLYSDSKIYIYGIKVIETKITAKK